MTSSSGGRAMAALACAIGAAVSAAIGAAVSAAPGASVSGAPGGPLGRWAGTASASEPRAVDACRAVGWREVTVGGWPLRNVSSLAGDEAYPRVYAGSRRGTNNVMLASGSPTAMTWEAETAFAGVPVTDVVLTPEEPTEVWVSTFGIAPQYDGPVYGASRGRPFAVRGALRSWFLAMTAGEEGTFVATSKPGDRGVYRWEESSSTWGRVGGDTIETGAFHALETGGDGRMWLGTDARGLWRSADGGVTWQEVTEDGADLLSVWSVAVSPGDPQRILMGLGPPDDVADEALLAHLLEPALMPDRRFRPTGGRPSTGGSGTVRAVGDYRRGLAISSDGGERWVFASAAGLSQADIVTDIAFHPTAPEVVFAAGYSSGLFVSSDAGSNWQPFPVPVQEQVHFEALLVVPVSDACQLLFAGGQNGLFVRSLAASHRSYYLPALANRSGPR